MGIMDKVPVNFLHGAFFDHIRKLSLMCGGHRSVGHGIVINSRKSDVKKVEKNNRDGMKMKGKE